MLVRKNNVPLLLRDSITLLLHFTLILPMPMDRSLFTTLVRQVYNICWIQTCLKIVCRLPQHLRNSLRDEWRRSESSPGNPLKVDTLASGLGILVSNLDASGIFNDNLCDDSLPNDVTMDQLEARVQDNCLPYLRIAALLLHFMYSEQLPDIWEQDWEFTRLSQFLGMTDMDISSRVASAPCLDWLVTPAELVSSWTRDMEPLVLRSHSAARKLILVNNIWRQPQLLKLPKRYDAIFQVYSISPSRISDLSVVDTAVLDAQKLVVAHEILLTPLSPINGIPIKAKV